MQGEGEDSVDAVATDNEAMQVQSVRHEGIPVNAHS